MRCYATRLSILHFSRGLKHHGYFQTSLCEVKLGVNLSPDFREVFPRARITLDTMPKFIELFMQEDL